MTSGKKGFTSISDILEDIRKNTDDNSLPLEYSRDKYISREFQKYGYELAKELGDLKNKSLYIKLAKTTPRKQLEETKSFIKDAANVKNITALFLWKLKEIKGKKDAAKKVKK